MAEVPPPAALRPALALIAATTLARLAVAAAMPLVDDEAYYWTWSTRLAAGYYDHPPAIAWLIAAGTAVFGATPLGVRAAGIVLTGAASATLLPRVREPLLLAAVLAALPLFALGGVLATPDVPLLAGWMLALGGLHGALEAPRARDVAWLGAGGALAALGKYTAWGFWPLALAAALWTDGRRPGRRTAAVGAGAALALAGTAPNLLWNASHDWVSVRFQLHHGLGATAAPGIGGALGFLGAQAALGGGVVFVAALAAAWTHRREAAARAALLTSVPVVAFFTWAASRSRPEANWAATGFVGLAMLLAGPLGASPAPRVTRAGWVGVGVAGALSALVVAHAFHPFLRVPNDPVARLGQGARLAEPVAAWGSPVVWTERYQDAALLRWYGGPALAGASTLPGVARTDQFDLWRAEDGAPTPTAGLYVRPRRSGEATAADAACARGGPNEVAEHDAGGAVTARWQVYELRDCRFDAPPADPPSGVPGAPDPG